MRLVGFEVMGGQARLRFADAGGGGFVAVHVPAASATAPADWTQADLEAAAAAICAGHGAEFAGSDVTLTPRPLRKLLVVDRMTDEELAAALLWFDSGTAAATRARERWNAAVEVAPDDAAAAALFEALFGAERTAELLAPEAADPA